MSDLRVARRYASALRDMADQGNPEAVASDLEIVRAAVRESPELRRLLVSPVVSKEKKKGAMAEIFRGKVGNEVLRFLDGIVEKRRENILPQILSEYFALRDEQLGIIHVEVRTASQFSGMQEKELGRKLESFSKKKARITFSLDTSLKGGFVARLGDTMLDGSIRRQLERMRQRFKDGMISH